MNKIVRNKKNMINFLSIFFLILLSVSSTYANTPQQVDVAKQMTIKRVTIDVKDQPIQNILNIISKQSGIGFAMVSSEAKQELTKITLKVKGVTVEDAITQALIGKNFTFKVVENLITIVKIPKVVKPTGTPKVIIKGKVLDSDAKKPLVGATVLIKGTSNGSITDINGNYALSLAPEDGIIVSFTYVGYNSKDVMLGRKSMIDVTLSPSSMEVDDVVVIGYGERTKKELISSVSTITADELKESTSANVLSLLQGRVAGLEVNQQSGAPGGGGNKVAVRGYTSMSGVGKADNSLDGSPLYVIDGIPVQSSISALSGTDPLAMLDPATIESVEVLKDAASAAIYGSRAANGVILITTKKGKKGQSDISFQATYAMSQLPTSPVQTGGNFERMYADNMLRNHLRGGFDVIGSGANAIRYNKRYPTSYEEAYKKLGEYDKYWNMGSGSDVPMLQDSLNNFYNNSTHWFKEVFRIGKVLDAKLQAQGGTDKVQYMIAGGFFNETGIMYSSNFSRYSLMSNINAQPSKRIALNTQITLGYSDRSTGPGSGNSMGPKMAVEGYTVNPFDTPTLLPSDNVTKEQLFKKMNSTSAKMDDYSLRGSLQLIVNIIDGLNISSSLGINLNQSNSNVYEPGMLDLTYHEGKSTGRITRNIQFQNENLITYQKRTTTGHNIELLAGLSLNNDQSHELSGFGKGNTNDNIHYYTENSPGIVVPPSGNPRNLLKYYSFFEESAMIGYFGRIAYNYKQRYLTEVSVRKDGSSMFGENNKYAVFPSVALGWNVKEEHFLSSVWWLDIAKIRGSWGTSGQVFKKPYIAHGVLETTTMIDGRVGMQPSGNLINKDLTWEESDQYDIGFDLTFLNYRINAKVDYYYKLTTGLMTEVDLPGNFYASTKQDRNAARVSNEGIEFELDLDILRETAVKWKMSFNISRNQNKFIKAYDNLDLGTLIIGRPLYTMIAYKDDGLYQYDSDVPLTYSQDGYPISQSDYPASKEFYTAGQRKIRDVNGDGMINDSDKVYIGSPLPKAYGGWSNNLKWKNLSLDLHFSYSLGRKIIAQYLASDPSMSSGPYFADLPGMSFWEKPGGKNVYPQLHNFTTIAVGTDMVESEIQNVNYIKLRQLTFGYNLSQKALRKIGLSDLRFFFTAENLFTLTNYTGMDPEIVSIGTGVDNLASYPLSRKFSFGINVKF